MMVQILADAVAARRRVVLATVTATDRSVPRRPGTKMLIFADGTTIGTIGGGEMEARVRREAVDMIERATSSGGRRTCTG